MSGSVGVAEWGKVGRKLGGGGGNSLEIGSRYWKI